MGRPKPKGACPCLVGVWEWTSVLCSFHWVTWPWPPVCLHSVPGAGRPHPSEMGGLTFHPLSTGAGALGGAGVPGGVAGELKPPQGAGQGGRLTHGECLLELFLCLQELDLLPQPPLPKLLPKLPSSVSTSWG